MIADYMDSTNLKPEASRNDIIKLCNEAIQMQLKAVCVNPYRLDIAVKALQDTPVKKCTVIGFPLGADRLETKCAASQAALIQGADELDVVINVGALKDGDFHIIDQEIKAHCQLKNESEFVLKVIVETALLSELELVTITKLISDHQVDFIKTSTGFNTRGASLKDIALINQHKSNNLKVKASGGIRTLESALAFIEVGVERIGSSNAGNIVKEYRMRGGLLRR